MNTRKLIGSVALVLGLLTANVSLAQAPAGAPAGAAGLCNDGTYFKGTMKIGACTGHKGLKTWYGVPPKTAAKTTTSSTSKTVAKSGPSNAPAKTSSTTAQAPGGGPGLVWVNTASKVYHCPGTQYYGKTKTGSYMSEADAKAKGAHPVGGKPCGK